MYNSSPLRYPGGKAKIYNKITNILNKNNIENCTYIEPFAGGAGLALNLLFTNKVKNIIINDLDISIYSFWYSILNYTDDFIDKIINTQINIENWYINKEIQENKNNQTLFDLGFSTFYLNRTNHSGIINAGIIGGINQAGKYKLDCRFNKIDLIKKIELIAKNKNRITLYNKDCTDLINNNIMKMKKNYFIFFDPPYYNKGYQLYQNYFNHYDHLNLSNKIKLIKEVPWIITYDNVNEIKNMYNEFNQIEYDLNYSTGKVTKGKEVMIFSNSLVPLMI